jgi:hypothetical protein
MKFRGMDVKQKLFTALVFFLQLKKNKIIPIDNYKQFYGRLYAYKINYFLNKIVTFLTPS